MKYWIFVHKNEEDDKETPESFERLFKGEKNWVVPSSARVNPHELQPGDIVVFYLGGPYCMYFSGEARLATGARKPDPTRKSIGGRTISLKEEVGIRENLNFIEDTKNWGRSFQRSVISIEEEDYETIKSYVR
jgi:hypothetical protein